MNPVTLLEAFMAPSFLLGAVLGLVASLFAWAHRRTDVWLASVGAAIIAALWVNGRILGLPMPPLALGAVGAGTVLLAAIGVWRVVQEAGPVTVGACLALTALGVWGTVPDTENAIVLLGAASGGTLGALRVTGARGSVAVAAIGVLAAAAFISLTDGLGRSSAPMGSLATFGIFLIAPLGYRLWRGVPPWAWVAVHVALVIFCGRVAGQVSSAEASAAMAGAALLGAAAALTAFSRWRPDLAVLRLRP